MEKITKKYSNGDVTIIWRPDLCNHSAICFRTLPNVFKPWDRPWIDPNAASTEDLIKTVKRCPTRALMYEINAPEPEKEEKGVAKESAVITILQDGPILVEGHYRVIDEQGNEIVCREDPALCRCGASKKKPFCDGTHADIMFTDE